MRPDVVTFWHGPLDALRRTCLRSQVAAGHRVTVYSFEPLAGLPDGVGNAEAEAILPYSFSERLRPPQLDGSWRDWTTLQFSDFFRMRLMAQRQPVRRQFFLLHQILERQYDGVVRRQIQNRIAELPLPLPGEIGFCRIDLDRF